MRETYRFNHHAIVTVEKLKPVERNEFRSVLWQEVKLELRIAPDHLPDEILAGLVNGECKVWLEGQPCPES